MTDWIGWFVWAGIIVVGELLIGTFYLVMIALGCVAGGLAALLGMSLQWQLVIAALVGIIAVYTLRKSKLIKRRFVGVMRNPDVNLDIGQTISIRADQWQHHNGRHTARVKYRGAMWDVELEPNAMIATERFIICEIRGSQLIVQNDVPTGPR